LKFWCAAKRHSQTATIVLMLGIGVAGLVYWRGTRSPDLSDDPSMSGFNRAETRQMEQLCGKSGDLIEEWSNDLNQPGTQAMIIAIGSAIVAAGCFYFARRLDFDDHANG
jgi:hypothetical protein